MSGFALFSFYHLEKGKPYSWETQKITGITGTTITTTTTTRKYKPLVSTMAFIYMENLQTSFFLCMLKWLGFGGQKFLYRKSVTLTAL